MSGVEAGLGMQSGFSSPQSNSKETRGRYGYFAPTSVLIDAGWKISTFGLKYSSVSIAFELGLAYNKNGKRSHCCNFETALV